MGVVGRGVFANGFGVERLLVIVLIAQQVGLHMPVQRVAVGHEVGGEQRAGVGFVQPNRRVLHDLRCTEDAFHFARLHAVSVDGHLLVNATAKINRSVEAPAATVARSVHPRVVCFSERVGDKPRVGFLRAPHVSERHARTADAELAKHAGRHRMSGCVQNVYMSVVDRASDGDGPVGAQASHRRAHGRFGRAVAVEQHHRIAPSVGHVLRTRLARHDDRTEIR